MIRYVRKEDWVSWHELDSDLPDAGFDEKVRDRRGYVYVRDGKIVGVLRYNLFWDTVPFCTHLYVEEGHRMRGYGRRLMERWEKDMERQGFDMLMTSTQVDEEGQHFYRRLGYRDCGGFVMDVPGHEQPMEMILVKEAGTCGTAGGDGGEEAGK